MGFKIKKRFLIPVLVLGLYFSGPRVNFEPVQATITPMDLSLTEIDSFIAHREAGIAKIKPNNASRIIWADSIRKTPYVVVYLHGFSASAVEGAPLHQDFAKRYGCNLYLPRLAEHGIDDKESFLHLTPEKLMESARQAIAIGKLLGDKVILMSCSTGSTLSAYLAAHNPEYVDALMMYSPNFALGTPIVKLLTAPWGAQLGKLVSGGDYRTIELPETCYPYWTVTYRNEGIIALQDLLEQTMTEDTYQKIKQPYLVGYYYKNEEEQDFVISMDEIKKFGEQSNTPEDQKRLIAFPDVNSHVIVSDLQSQDLESVIAESYRFAEDVLGLVPQQ